MSSDDKFGIFLFGLLFCLIMGVCTTVAYCTCYDKQISIEAIKAGLTQQVDPITRKVIWVKEDSKETNEVH
jgi:hypothetical protein